MYSPDDPVARATFRFAVRTARRLRDEARRQQQPQNTWISRWRGEQVAAAMAAPNWSQLIPSEQSTVTLAIEHTAPGRACYASQSHLARKLGVCRKTVNEHLGKAVKLGILTCTTRIVNHRRTTNLYSVAVECWAAFQGAMQRSRRRPNARAELDNQPSRAEGSSAT
jgi:hypothetical protein